jgi:hypothetical protein
VRIVPSPSRRGAQVYPSPSTLGGDSGPVPSPASLITVTPNGDAVVIEANGATVVEGNGTS